MIGNLFQQTHHVYYYYMTTISFLNGLSPTVKSMSCHLLLSSMQGASSGFHVQYLRLEWRQKQFPCECSLLIVFFLLFGAFHSAFYKKSGTYTSANCCFTKNTRWFSSSSFSLFSRTNKYELGFLFQIERIKGNSGSYSSSIPEKDIELVSWPGKNRDGGYAITYKIFVISCLSLPIPFRT